MKPRTTAKVPMSVRLSPNTFRKMSKLARAQDRTRSYIVEKAVAEYLARHSQYADRRVPTSDQA